MSKNLELAAQYAYDNYLSKPYTNTSVPFDWDLKCKDGTIINRPNHGLAHSLRGAMYAPVVIDYFNKYAQNKEQFQFTPEEIEKIQIVLMFRVAGRENEAGSRDDPEAYKRYQENHGNAFKAFCNDNPGIFSDEEKEKYTHLLQTYASSTQTDPLTVILKTCHCLDLLRCFRNDILEKAIKPARDLIGEHTDQLLIYSSRCIEATGTRFVDNNPITNTSQSDYNEDLFKEVSTDPKKCLEVIANVPTHPEVILQKTGQPQQMLWQPTEDSPYTHKIIANNNSTADTYKTTAATLLGKFNAAKVISDMTILMNNADITMHDKAKLLHNSSMLLSQLILAEVPPATFKSLVDYLNLDIKKRALMKKDPIILAYDKLAEAAQQHPELRTALIDFEKNNKSAASKVNLQVKKQQTAIKNLNPAKEKKVNIKNFIAIDLREGIKKKHGAVQDLGVRSKLGLEVKSGVKYTEMLAKADALASSLKGKNIEQILALQKEDFYKNFGGDKRHGLSVANWETYTRNVTNNIKKDISNGTSEKHKRSLFDFYCNVMAKSIEKNDLNTAFAIYNALPKDEFQHHIDKKKAIKRILGKADSIFADKQSYEAHVAAQSEMVVPSSSHFISKMDNSLFPFKNQKELDTGFHQIVPHAEKALNQINVLKEKALAEKITISVDTSHYGGPKAPSMKVMTDELEKKANLHFTQLDSDLSISSPLDQTAYIHLLTSISEIIGDIAQLTNKGPEGFDAERINVVMNRVMIMLQAVEQHAIDNSMLSGVVQQQIEKLKGELELQGKKPLSETELAAEKSKQKYFLGRAMSFRREINKAAEKTEVERVPLGPIPINQYTKDYQALVKGMLAGKEFAHKLEKINDKEQLIIFMDGKEYNLNEIMKYANLTQLHFDDADKEAYANMLKEDRKLTFAPHKPNEQNPKMPIAVKGAEEVDALDASFLERDPRLGDISKAERLALNIYSTGAFKDMNAMMRGNTPATSKLPEEGYLKELLCSTGMAVTGLRSLHTDVPIASFRAEQRLPQFLLDARIDAANTQGVTMEAGFVSTAQGKPVLDFGFKEEASNDSAGFVFTNLKGKDISGLSAFPHEKEFLIPPTQMQWEAHTTVSGGHLFLASPVITPLGLHPEALKPFMRDVLPESDKPTADYPADTNPAETKPVSAKVKLTCLDFAEKFNQEGDYKNMLNLLELAIFHQKAGAHGTNQWKINAADLPRLQELVDNAKKSAQQNNDYIAVQKFNPAFHHLKEGSKTYVTHNVQRNRSEGIKVEITAPHLEMFHNAVQAVQNMKQKQVIAPEQEKEKTQLKSKKLS